MEIVVSKTPEIVAPDDLKTLTTEQLKQALATHMQLTVEHFTRIAHIVRELEDRGEDLESLKLSLLNYFRKIAAGQLSAHAVVRFAQRNDLLSRVAQLPLPDQDFLAAGGPVSLVVRQDGTMTTRLLDPLNLDRTQIFQVFGKGEIRSESQQVAFLESIQRERLKPTSPVTGRLRPDHARGGLILGRQFFHADDILTALASLNETVEEVGESTTVTLDVAHAKRLKIQAAKRDTTIRELIVRACRACGLLSE